jgi:hypothetical protein
MIPTKNANNNKNKKEEELLDIKIWSFYLKLIEKNK